MTEVAPPRSYPFNRTDGLEVDPALRECRARPGLVRVRLPYGRPAWLATRHEDVKMVLGDNRFSRALAIGEDEPRVIERAGIPTSMSAMDPPEQGRLRRVVLHAFTVRRVRTLQKQAESTVSELLDAMECQGPPADLVEDYALPLSITMLCELLGVSRADQTDFRNWAGSLLSTAADLPVERLGNARMRIGKYLTALIARRREEPADDLLSAMVHARDEEDRLTEPELVKLGTTLLTSGFENSASQIGNICYLLLTEPDLHRQLRESPDLVPQAIEELMRFIPNGTAGAALTRVAREDVEVGGFLVRAGEAVVADVQAANRDPAAFTDPDRVDFTRDGSAPHFSFGHGAHHCIGAQLARMEMQVAIEALLPRFPDLRLAIPAEQLEWKTSLIRGCVNLPVEW